MVDKHTKDRTRVQFARVLVEMDIFDNSDCICWFVNEYGQLVEQEIEYEWLPVKCNHCKGYGHIMADWRKKDKPLDVKTGQKVEVVTIKLAGNKSIEGQEEWKHDQATGVEIIAIYAAPKHKGSGSSKKAGVEQQRVLRNSFEFLGENQREEEAVLDILRLNNVGVGALVETKIKGDRFVEMMQKRFVNWNHYTSSEIEGRILLVWRKGFVHVEVEEESNQHVHCRIKMIGQQKDFFATFIYGANSIDGRLELWRCLSGINVSKAWIILGDFNAVFHHEDRLGGNPISAAELVDSNNWLMQAKDYKQLVMDSWSRPIRSHGLKGVFYKTMRLKHKLKAFNKSSIGDIGNSYDEAKAEYKDAQSDLQAAPLGSSKIEKRKQGRLNDHFPEVVQHFLNHFQNIMGKEKPTSRPIQQDCIDMGSILTLDQQVHLLKPFSLKEVRTAMFSIPSTKSPGPDGFGSGFFKSIWLEVGKEIYRAIIHFFETNKFPANLHNTALSLVPKVENPSKAIDYRPIACCTTLYKCISKLLCSRLAKVLPTLVNQNQDITSAGAKGKFRASKLYNSLIFLQRIQLIRAIWCRLNVPKQSFILWQTAHSNLLTRDKLVLFHITTTDLLCVVCGSDIENHQHLFFTCRFSKMVLEAVFAWVGFNCWAADFGR
uniref:Reverse transcriptase zinc-binding domain-containing protein n=1 Tax=Cannabis sativa TaxID=3483 RepID=A0A803PPY1_CANSA